MFLFHEGDIVAAASNELSSELQIGDEGLVWAMYDMEPPAYEVTFNDSSGHPFDVTCYDEEIIMVKRAAPSWDAAGLVEAKV